MSVFTSTLTTKGQTTVPEPIRAALGLESGKLLVWELTPDRDGGLLLAVRPVPELSQLAGCLKSDIPFVGLAEEKRAARRRRAKPVT